jgi:Na+-driven multidrug efflux pump
MLPMARGCAVNTLVANCLGAGQALGARSMLRAGMVLVVALQAAIAGGLVLGSEPLVQVG